MSWRAASSVLLAFLAAPGAGEERVVERRFSSELELATSSFEIVASSEGSSVEQQGPRTEREQADEIELTDTCEDEGQPPARFTRLYRTVMSSLRLSSEKSPKEKTASAALEGKLVTFERGDRGRYERSCEDTGVRRGQLDRLRADLSLACFLPPEEAESHSLSFARFQRILSPLEQGTRPARKKKGARAGGLNIAPASLMEPLPALLFAAEGELTVTPRARSEGDELPRNAELAFRFEASFDGSESLLAGPGEAEDEVTIVYEGTGSLAWDPDSGRIELRCEGEVRASERFVVRIENDGKSGEARGHIEMTGTLELEASEEPGE